MSMAERTLTLGSEQNIVATVLEPAWPSGQARSRWCAVLTNSGVIPRSGPHRMNVHLARHFAALGIPSIRFDMSGLGDSRRSTSPLPVVQQWVADTVAAMDRAQSEWGCDRFFMVGFCSGAEVAHLTALADPRLRAAVLWDFYAFPTPLSKLHRLRYRVQRAGLGGIARRLARRWMPSRATGQQVPAYQGLVSEASTSREEYTQRFRTLVDRGVELFFYYSGGEPEWYAYRGQFHDMFKGEAFLNKVAFDQLALSDHLITQQAAQRSFIRTVDRWLAQRVLNPPAR